jgi:hypothetical protein
MAEGCWRAARSTRGRVIQMYSSARGVVREISMEYETEAVGEHW